MKLLCLLLLFVLWGGTLSSYANENTVLPERVIWNDQAIPLHIQIGHERTVHFPEAIRYWLPDHLALKLTALSANGVLYLQAHQPFDKTRIRVQALNSQQLYLLDVQSNDTAGTSATLIVINPEQLVNEAQSDTPKKSLAQRDWYERLTRYAAQQLYAKERLVKSDAGIRRVAMDTVSLPGLLRDPRVIASAVASWTGGGLFVTAVRLHNTSTQTLALTFPNRQTALPAKSKTIDVTAILRGRWLAASVQHQDLQPALHRESMTTLYLLSDRPFFESWGIPHGE